MKEYNDEVFLFQLIEINIYFLQVANISSYSIMVQNLPKDTKKTDIIKFFSDILHR